MSVHQLTLRQAPLCKATWINDVEDANCVSVRHELSRLLQRLRSLSIALYGDYITGAERSLLLLLLLMMMVGYSRDAAVSAVRWQITNERHH